MDDVSKLASVRALDAEKSAINGYGVHANAIRLSPIARGNVLLNREKLIKPFKLFPFLVNTGSVQVFGDKPIRVSSGMYSGISSLAEGIKIGNMQNFDDSINDIPSIPNIVFPSIPMENMKNEDSFNVNSSPIPIVGDNSVPSIPMENEENSNVSSSPIPIVGDNSVSSISMENEDNSNVISSPISIVSAVSVPSIPMKEEVNSSMLNLMNRVGGRINAIRKDINQFGTGVGVIRGDDVVIPEERQSDKIIKFPAPDAFSDVSNKDVHDDGVGEAIAIDSFSTAEDVEKAVNRVKESLTDARESQKEVFNSRKQMTAEKEAELHAISKQEETIRGMVERARAEEEKTRNETERMREEVKIIDGEIESLRSLREENDRRIAELAAMFEGQKEELTGGYVKSVA